jgi:glutamate synthase (ferredoxin)
VLEPRRAVEHWKSRGLDFSNILYQPEAGPEVGRYCQTPQDHGLDKSLDMTTCSSTLHPRHRTRRKSRAELPIRNVNRVVGTITGSELTRRHGAAGLPDDTIRIRFKGSAGQSFGAFMPRGMTFTLEGDANDYVGKGLSGGQDHRLPPSRLHLRPRRKHHHRQRRPLRRHRGEGFIRGMAGERFCVRNSGVDAVVEAVGDHGCEYMTGGRVVILGPTGRNFAAGMSGGIAYVLDETGDFASRCNTEMVALSSLEDRPEEIETSPPSHRIATRTSPTANEPSVLALWENYCQIRQSHA